MLRQSAKQLCPNLIILEGSDLQHYRKFSRTIYASFRHAIIHNYHPPKKVAVKKGGMDEMFADISEIIDDKLMKNNDDQSHTRLSSFPSSCFVFGNTTSSSSSEKQQQQQQQQQQNRISITEDQTGSKVQILDRQYSNFIMDASSSSSLSSLPQYPLKKKDQVIFRTACVDRFKIASHIATDIQTRIKEETGFTTCIGISTSPMMAKLASELQKPNSINVVFPWRSYEIVKDLPLRRIPGLGSKTYRALLPCLNEYNNKTKKSSSSSREEPCWTCSDLLSVPRNIIEYILANFGGSKERARQRCDLLLEQCKGNDLSPIIDDDGGLPKTVSVEESFIRGSVRTMSLVISNLRILVKRLLHLLDERIDMSINNNNNNNNNSTSERMNNLAYPNTLRVSIRLVDESLLKGGGVRSKIQRPFVTKSKQTNFDGSSFHQILSFDDKVHSLFSKFEKIVNELLLLFVVHQKKDLNVTKLNIAAVNFQDVLEKEKRNNNKISSNKRCTKKESQSSSSSNGTAKRQKTVKSFFTPNNRTAEPKPKQTSTNSKLFGMEQSHKRRSDTVVSGSIISSKKYNDKLSSSPRLSMMTNEEKAHTSQNATSSEVLSSPDNKSSTDKHTNDETNLLISGIDPNVLNELPPDIISEILQNGVVPLSTITPKQLSFTKKKKGIERFFPGRKNNATK